MSKTHQKVIEDFITEGKGGRGTYVVARERDHVVYSAYRRRWETNPHRIPLAIEVSDGGFLVNGARLDWPRDKHQRLVLRTLEVSQAPFGVVPLDSITAAWTNGKIRSWSQAPFTLKDIRRETEIAVPSVGERWQHVEVKDKYGRIHTQTVHTLGDSVIRLRDHFYLSGVDETGINGSIYFLARLVTDRAPTSFEDALSFLKPRVVQDAEARGANVLRQGEWFAVPTMLMTSKLLRDVEQGIAVRREQHVLGRDGHHRLEEAVIYRCGPRKGEVYARGSLVHTRVEHMPMDLGFRWHLVVHNVQGASYSLVGNFD
jgi:hypothetical protein